MPVGEQITTPAAHLLTLMNNFNRPANNDYRDAIFIGKMPDEPANCIVYYDTGGPEQDPRNAIIEAHVQVCVRNSSYPAGYKTSCAIQETLLGRQKRFGSTSRDYLTGEETLSSMSVVGIWSLGQIAFTHYDERGRAVFSSNYRVVLEPPQGYIDPRTNIEGIGNRHAV